MTKLYNITLSTTVVVAADSPESAIDRANYDMIDIAQDTDWVADSAIEVTTDEHLPDGWDAESIPYGGDGNTRIGKLFDSKHK